MADAGKKVSARRPAAARRPAKKAPEATRQPQEPGQLSDFREHGWGTRVKLETGTAQQPSLFRQWSDWLCATNPSRDYSSLSPEDWIRGYERVVGYQVVLAWSPHGPHEGTRVRCDWVDEDTPTVAANSHLSCHTVLKPKHGHGIEVVFHGRPARYSLTCEGEGPVVVQLTVTPLHSGHAAALALGGVPKNEHACDLDGFLAEALVAQAIARAEQKLDRASNAPGFTPSGEPLH